MLGLSRGLTLKDLQIFAVLLNNSHVTNRLKVNDHDFIWKDITDPITPSKDIY